MKKVKINKESSKSLKEEWNELEDWQKKSFIKTKLPLLYLIIAIIGALLVLQTLNTFISNN